MLDIFTGTDFDADLAGLPHQDLINVFLEEVGASVDARWQMTKRLGEWYTPHFNVKGVESLLKQGYNIYRIRPLLPSLKDYRIIYAYDAEYDEFYLLAVAIKKTINAPSNLSSYHYNYEPTHPITVRICDEYDRRGIPRIC